MTQAPNQVGQAIAQFDINKCVMANVVEVDTLPEAQTNDGVIGNTEMMM